MTANRPSHLYGDSVEMHSIVSALVDDPDLCGELRGVMEAVDGIVASAYEIGNALNSRGETWWGCPAGCC